MHGLKRQRSLSGSGVYLFYSLSLYTRPVSVLFYTLHTLFYLSSVYLSSPLYVCM